MATIRKRAKAARRDGTIPIVVSYTDQQGKRRTKTFRRVKDAEAWKIETQKQVKDGTHTPEYESVTVLQAAYLWVEYGELHGIRPDVNFIRRNRIYNHLREAPIANVKLARLTTNMVGKFYDDLLRGGASRNLAADIMTIVKAAMKHAHARGLVAQNVASAIRINREEKQKLVIGVHVPDKEEAARLVERVPDQWRAFVVTALFTGMRPSELRALEWGDIDFGKKVIRVLRGADSKRRIHLPKTLAGQREIPMLPEVCNVLRQHAKDALSPVTYGHWGYRHVSEAMLARHYGRMPDKPIMKAHQYLFYQRHFDQLEELAKADEWEKVRAWTYTRGNNGPRPQQGESVSGYVTRLYKYKADLLAAHDANGSNVVNLAALRREALVFPNFAGKIYHLCSLQEHFDAAQLAADVAVIDPQTGERKRKYSLYALRHFFASWLIDTGEPPEKIKEMMGHKSIQITYDVYGHLFPDRKADYERLAAAQAELLATKTRPNATIVGMPQRN